MGINRGTVLTLINDVNRAGGFKDYNSYSYLFDQVDTMPESKEDTEPHWIPVTERLPDNSRNVLITSRGGVSIAWYNGSYFEKGANTHHREMQTVTAWCELPEPFKGVTT